MKLQAPETAILTLTSTPSLLLGFPSDGGFCYIKSIHVHSSSTIDQTCLVSVTKNAVTRPIFSFDLSMNQSGNLLSDNEVLGLAAGDELIGVATSDDAVTCYITYVREVTL